jgi:hypothetical protein
VKERPILLSRAVVRVPLYKDVHLNVVLKVDRPTGAVSTIVLAAYGTELNGDSPLGGFDFSITDQFLPEGHIEHLGSKVRIQTCFSEVFLLIRRQLIESLVGHVRFRRVCGGILA